MRKYFLVLLMGAALSLFTVAATAQNASDGNTAAGNPPETKSDVPTQPGIGSDGDTQADLGVKRHGVDQSQKTLEGCVVKENTDYFIQPANGERRHLTGSQDFASAVGKHVRVKGEDENVAASNANSSNQANANSGSGSSETQNNAAGSIAGNAGSSNASGTGTSNSMDHDFFVTKIETVSESCPANIQNKIDQNKSK